MAKTKRWKYPAATPFQCERCKGKWHSRFDSNEPPTACAKCKSRSWASKPRAKA